MMFNVVEGGVVEPVEVSASNLAPDKSLILVDEENLRVWLWHGKLRGLVPRRMAMRQAESLKGHGYQAGNAIVGRGLQEIVEIDGRKIGAVELDTKLNDEFIAVLNRTYKRAGDMVFVPTEGGIEQDSCPAPKPTQKPVETSKPAPKVESTQADPKPTPRAEEVHTAPKQSAKVEEHLKPKEEHEVKPSSTVNKASASDSVKKGLMILAVMDQFKDLWISRKQDDMIAVEQMDGKICSFQIVNGEIKFSTGSFAEINPEVKTKIDAKYKELLGNL